MRALVTGGAGFIGSNLVDALLARGARVRVLDDFSTGREQNLAAARAHAAFELVRDDLRSLAACEAAVRDVDVVFHHAAVASVTASVAEPLRTHEVNVDGTVRLLEAARRAGVGRVVFAASSAAYGEGEAQPKTEAMRPEPVSPYGVHKVAGEHYLAVYAKLHGMRTCALRYFNVFGPRQDPKSEYAAVVPRFLSAALAGVAPTIFGDGEQTRDFCYIDNVVEANLRAAKAEVRGDVVNVATGVRTSLNELVAAVNEVVGTRLEARHAPPREGDIRHSSADISRARALLGFEPTVPLREGLRRTMTSLATSAG